MNDAHTSFTRKFDGRTRKRIPVWVLGVGGGRWNQNEKESILARETMAAIIGDVAPRNAIQAHLQRPPVRGS